MGRGLGRLQRRTLELLDAHHARHAARPLTVRQLARAVYGPAPTHAQREALRQAVEGLERRGLVRTWPAPRGATWRGRRIAPTATDDGP